VVSHLQTEEKSFAELTESVKLQVSIANRCTCNFRGTQDILFCGLSLFVWGWFSTVEAATPILCEPGPRQNHSKTGQEGLLTLLK